MQNGHQNTLLLIDTIGIVAFISKSFTDNFGYQPQDVVGRNFSMFFIEEDIIKRKPEIELETVIRVGHSTDNNYLVAKSGKNLWVAGESLFVKEETQNYIVKIIQNIHDHKETELERTRLIAFNENILSSIEDCVVVLNSSREIIKYNKAFSDLFMPQNGLFGYQHLISLVKSFEKQNEIEDSIDNIIFKKKLLKFVVFEATTVSGEKRVFELNGSPLVKDGSVNEVLLVLHDITTFKQLEKEREDLMGFVAHELRNPLTNLSLCEEIIEEALHNKKIEEAQKVLSTSKKSLKRLNRMIGELYTATKIHSGNLDLKISKFPVDEMIREAVETIQNIHPSYNIRVQGETQQLIEGDKFRLIEVITNLLSNAIKYSGEAKDVAVSLKSENDSLTVSVTDFGIGIPAGQIPFMFQRFFRAEKTRNLEGIGLGLYLCKKIVSAHHGKIWVESEEGKGSSFSFSIPATFSPTPGTPLLSKG